MSEEDQKLMEALNRILELNTMIAKQNAIILQALTLPIMLVERDKDQ